MHIWIDARSSYAFEKIYSITLIERILRQLFELGINKHVTVIIKPNLQLDRFIRKDFWPRYPLEFYTVYSEEPLSTLMKFEKDTDQPLIPLEGDGIYDERVLKKLLTSTHSLYIHNRRDEEEPIAVIVQPDHRRYLNTNTIRIEKILQDEVPND